MNAGKYLSGFVSENLPVSVLPALLFVLGAVMAFSTGTSWGNICIMLPIAAAIAAHAAPELLLPCLSAVMVELFVVIIVHQYQIRLSCPLQGQNVITWITLKLNYLTP